MKHYNVSEVARILKSNHIPVLNTSECMDEMDGSVEVTEHISVQVPTYDHGLIIVTEENGSYGFSDDMDHIEVVKTLKREVT